MERPARAEPFQHIVGARAGGDELGLGRAYVSGELEVDDIDAVIELLDRGLPATRPATLSA